MRLSDLLHAAGLPATTLPDVTISGITSDSRQCKPGTLFVAIAGAKDDGKAYVEAARRNGAVAFLGQGLDGPHISVNNPRAALARLAAAFYPRQPATIAAVTGTKGKSSIVDLAQQLWNLTGHKAASIGTRGVIGPGLNSEGSLTTPEPVELHATLQSLAEQNVQHVALEASSIGIIQHRLDGVKISSACFCNFGRDHLDVHQTMAAYFAAKADLFSRLLPEGAPAILNADISEFAPLAEIAARRGQPVVAYGKAGREIVLHNAQATPDGLNLRLSAHGEPFAGFVPVSGAFQAGNILAALGLVLASGVAPRDALAALPALTSVRGRMELVGKTPRGAAIYVDYAHTPESLQTVLQSARDLCRGRLHVVFGCGGNRDKGKRPLMGEIACRLADFVYVTDDNPRHEDAATIRAEIMVAAPSAREIGGRAKAIQVAIAALESGDILVIAGKGHEQGQKVGDEVFPFDDAAVAQGALKELA